MTASVSMLLQNPATQSRFRGQIDKSDHRRGSRQGIQSLNRGGRETVDFLHREDFTPSAVSAAAGTSTADRNYFHTGTSLQVTQPYQGSVEGACMKNRNKLQSCLQVRDEIARALRRDLSRFRSAARELAEICGKSERTAANWLSGATGMSAEDLLVAAEALSTVRDMVVAKISPPDDYTLAQELTVLRARLARAEARYREEFNVEDAALNRVDFPMDGGCPSRNVQVEYQRGGYVGAHPTPAQVSRGSSK